MTRVAAESIYFEDFEGWARPAGDAGVGRRSGEGEALFRDQPGNSYQSFELSRRLGRWCGR